MGQLVFALCHAWFTTRVKKSAWWSWLILLILAMANKNHCSRIQTCNMKAISWLLQPHIGPWSYILATSCLLTPHLCSWSHMLAPASTYWFLQPHIGNPYSSIASTIRARSRYYINMPELCVLTFSEKVFGLQITSMLKLRCFLLLKIIAIGFEWLQECKAAPRTASTASNFSGACSWHHVTPSLHPVKHSWHRLTPSWHHVTPSWYHVIPSLHHVKYSWHRVTTSWHHVTPCWHYLTPSWHTTICHFFSTIWHLPDTISHILFEVRELLIKKNAA